MIKAGIAKRHVFLEYVIFPCTQLNIKKWLYKLTTQIENLHSGLADTV